MFTTAIRRLPGSSATIAIILAAITLSIAGCSEDTPPPTPTVDSAAPTISALSALATEHAPATPEPSSQRPRPALPPIPRPVADTNSGRATWLQEQHPEIHRQLVALPWVADGPDALERSLIDQIVDAAALSASLSQDLIYRHWVKDDINILESQIITALVSIAKSDRTLAAEIAAMPFLYSPSHSDLIILQSIQDLLAVHRVVALTQSPIYREGIVDEHAPLLAAAAAASPDGPAIQRYLRNQGVAIESRTFNDMLPPLTVTILRRKANNSDPSTIHHVRDAVDMIESIMDTTLPQRHIIIAFDSALTDIASSSTFHNQLIAVRDERVKSRPDGRLHLLYREIARHWWHNNAEWIDEGMVYTIAKAGSRLDDAPWLANPLPRLSCQAPNIRTLDQATSELGAIAQHCDRHLGEALFRDLHNADTPAFSDSARQLLGMTPAGVDQVKTAFPNHVATIDQHYHGDHNAPYRWDPDDAIDAPNHAVVSWTTKPSTHQERVRFAGKIKTPALLADPSLAFTISDNQRLLATILPPLQDPQDEPEQTARYVFAERVSIQGDSFDVHFRWPTGAGSPDGKTITVWGYRNQNLAPVIGQSADPLSISLIRPDLNPPAIVPTPRPTHPLVHAATLEPGAPTPKPTITALQHLIQQPSHTGLLSLNAGNTITIKGCNLAPDLSSRKFILTTWNLWEPERFGKELNLIQIVTLNGERLSLTHGTCYQATAVKHLNDQEGYICLDADAASPHQYPCTQPNENVQIPVFLLDTNQHTLEPIN